MRFNMRLRIVILMWIALLVFGVTTPPARAEIIDKVVAAVDTHIITLSDIRKEREILTVLGDPVGSDTDILKALIDRYLLEGQIEQFPDIAVTNQEVTDRMNAVSNLRGMAPAEIQAAITEKIRRRNYFNVRYRQFILVSDEEVSDYYKTVFVPKATELHADVPQLNEIESEIRANVFEEKLAREVETSLETLRSRSNIEIF